MLNPKPRTLARFYVLEDPHLDGKAARAATASQIAPLGFRVWGLGFRAFSLNRSIATSPNFC